MHFEVALLEWGDGIGRDGLRLVGRTSAPEMVEVVRDHLAGTLGDRAPERPRNATRSGLRLVRGRESKDEEEDES